MDTSSLLGSLALALSVGFLLGVYITRRHYKSETDQYSGGIIYSSGQQPARLPKGTRLTKPPRKP